MLGGVGFSWVLFVSILSNKLADGGVGGSSPEYSAFLFASSSLMIAALSSVNLDRTRKGRSLTNLDTIVLNLLSYTSHTLP